MNTIRLAWIITAIVCAGIYLVDEMAIYLFGSLAIVLLMYRDKQLSYKEMITPMLWFLSLLFIYQTYFLFVDSEKLSTVLMFESHTMVFCWLIFHLRREANLPEKVEG